jgi:hypothetical protein
MGQPSPASYQHDNNPILINIAQKLGECLAEIKECRTDVEIVDGRVKELSARVSTVERWMHGQDVAQETKQETLDRIARDHKPKEDEERQGGVRLNLSTRDLVWVLAVLAGLLSGNWKSILEVFTK